ncbi:SusC/RagA family TonB-linked outer membrane protein [Mucilaginibacter aquatilis]|uniref:SusC/RagA family TonB-linked outer membrane protein n=1 Tax=Mucilaginibacter aquatilis TaxID=1517760 RepID=A0A6I4ICK1_9SPHI|nr:SusC/RagA family TonB-linked outer membrane protein [Mucilaginibacter aquatilis]MVN92657.1 SusC/RagA family TonB-linked outer membrane protein [Mucilaginibacter aquatilis]
MDYNFLRKFSLLMLLCTLVGSVAMAQQRKVTGKVVDSLGTPLPGVNVSLKGLPSNVSTNRDGIYTIQVNSNKDILVFSFIGYIRKQVSVGSEAQLNVSLSQENSKLQEVVFVGYGAKKRSEILGSVATVTGQELQDIPAPNLAGSLRNRVAGLGVSQSSGRPGAAITLNIRNSVVSESARGVADVALTSEPLYVVDGITVTREAFDNIDASMVENLTFLKDASAAIYGASGAKGVVLVTTKRGKIGKPTLTYNGYYGVSDAAKTPEMMSAYDHAVLLNEGYRNSGASFSNYFLPADLEYLKTVNYKSWYDELWQASVMQRHNIGISGGSDKITFFAGGSYQRENANYAGLNINKYSFRSGIVASITQDLKADINFNVDWNIKNARSETAVDNDANFFERLVTIPQWVPISINGMNLNYPLTNNNLNPKALLESGYYENNKSRGYRINTSLTYQPSFFKGFTAKFQISQASTGNNSRQYKPPYKTYNFKTFGNNNLLYTDQLTDPATQNPVFENVSDLNERVTPSLSESNSYQGFLTLQYGRTFGKHTIGVLAGGEQSQSNQENLAINYLNQIIPGGEDYWAFDANTLTRKDISRYESSKRSFFGRVSYDFDKRYLLEFITRFDASSFFATGNRWGVAPSVGLGWVVSSEEFFKNSKPLNFINFLKLKANVGVTGDDRVGLARLWQDRYLIDVTNGYLYGNNNQNSLNPSKVGNPDLTWERKRTINVGLESSLFNNKLDFSVEVFQNYNYDGFDLGGNQLYPLYGGFLPAVVNYRKTYNWGTEVNLGYKAKLFKELNMSANVNFSYGNSVNDRLLYAPGQLINNIAPDWLINFGLDPRKWNSGNIGLKNSGMFRTQADVDSWMAKYPNYRIYDRIPQPGWLYYEDTNSDGVITDSDMQPMFENTNPWFSGGFTLNFSYRAFSLNTNIAARLGGKVFYDGRARTAPAGNRNVLDIWNDRWTPENPMSGKFPRFDDPSLGRNSDFWAVDGTTIRINTMTLSYKMPTKLVNKLGLQGARVLLTGNNLWTLVNPLKYKDPYTSSAWDYPVLTTISAGLSVNL